MVDGSEELRALCRQELIAIETIWRRTPYLLGITFQTTAGKITIIGEDHMLKDKTDIFSLSVSKYDEKKWWPEIRAEEGVRDLAREWGELSVSQLFRPPRNVRFFTDEDFDEILDTREAILMRCVAMEFSAPEDPKPRLLITAEQCNISVFIDDECEENIRPYFVEYDPGPF